MNQLSKDEILAEARPVTDTTNKIIVENDKWQNVGKLSMPYSEWARMAITSPTLDLVDGETVPSLFAQVIEAVHQTSQENIDQIKDGDHWLVYDPQANRVDVKRRGKRNEHRPKKKRRR